MPILNVNDMLRWRENHPRSAADRIEIRKKIAAVIAPVLADYGFVKVRSTFLRLHADYMLQSISVCYRANFEPSLQMLSTALYDFETRWHGYFQGIRSNCGVEGIMIATAAGLQIQTKSENDYLAFQTDMDAALEKEIELLKTDTIPRLDKTITCFDAIKLYQHKSYESYLAAVAFLWHKDYKQALQLYEKFIIPEQERLNETLRIQAIPKQERSFFDWPFPEEHFPLHIHAYEKKVEELQSKIDMLRENRINDFVPLMNRSMEEAYQEIGKLSKRFVQKYPCPPPITSIL